MAHPEKPRWEKARVGGRELDCGCGPQATSWLPVQLVWWAYLVWPAVCSKLPYEGACWSRPARPLSTRVKVKLDWKVQFAQFLFLFSVESFFEFVEAEWWALEVRACLVQAG